MFYLIHKPTGNILAKSQQKSCIENLQYSFTLLRKKNLGIWQPEIYQIKRIMQ